MLKISNVLLTKLKEIKADVESSLLILIGLSLDLNFEKIYSESNTMRKTIDLLLVHKVIDVDYKENKVIFNFPLFGKDETDEWKWIVDEYIPLFTSVRKDAGGSSIESVTNRMKRFFIDNPDTKKEDVIEAVKLYLTSDECSNSKYVQQADYFIKKGIGVNSTSRLSKYLSLVQEGLKDNSSFKMM